MTASYYENFPFVNQGFSSALATTNASRIFFTPFILPEDISVSLLRLPMSLSDGVANATGTSANTSFTMQRTNTDCFVLYSQGVGASSNSLMSMFSTTAGWTKEVSITAGANGSQYSYTKNFSFPVTPNGLSTYSFATAGTETRYEITEGPTDFNDMRLVDFPFATSVSAGNYWIGYGVSTNSSQNAGPAGLAAAANLVRFVAAVSQSNLIFGFPGIATNVSHHFKPGLGVVSTNAAIMSTGDIDLSLISIQASNPQFMFQMIRRA